MDRPVEHLDLAFEELEEVPERFDADRKASLELHGVEELRAGDAEQVAHRNSDALFREHGVDLLFRRGAEADELWRNRTSSRS